MSRRYRVIFIFSLAFLSLVSSSVYTSVSGGGARPQSLIRPHPELPQKSLPHQDKPSVEAGKSKVDASVDTPPNQPSNMIRISETLFINATSDFTSRGLISKYLDQPLPQEKLVVVSLLDSSSPEEREIQTATSTKFRHIDTSIEAIKELIVRDKPKFLLIVGHSENGFVVRNKIVQTKMIETGRIALESIEKIITQYGIPVFFMTCRGSTQVRAPTLSGDLWIPEVIVRLSKAVNASTYKDFYNAVGTSENPAIIWDVKKESMLGISVVKVSILSEIGSIKIDMSGVDPNILRYASPGSSDYYQILAVVLFFGLTFAAFWTIGSAHRSIDRIGINNDSLEEQKDNNYLDRKRELMKIGLDEDPEAIYLLANLPCSSPLASILDKVIDYYKNDMIGPAEVRMCLYQLGERARPFPSITDMGVSVEKYNAMKHLFISFEPKPLADELLLLLMAWRRGWFNKEELAKEIENIAASIES